jgi:hypothetical protein
VTRNRHVGWIASLKSGETVFERPANRGELSAWQQLLQRCRAGDEIVMLRLQRGGTTVMALPRRAKGSRTGSDGYFAGYEVRRSNNGQGQVTVQGIGSVMDDLIYITWVNDSGQVWQDVRSLDPLFVHTDQRQLIDIL